MKTGTHSLGSNAFSSATLAKVHAGGITLRQSVANGSPVQITLSVNQIALLKDVLA